MGIRYSCDYCYKDISSIVRLQCAECGLPSSTTTSEEGNSNKKEMRVSGAFTPNANLEEVDLCVECFAAGVEFGSHRKTHAYRILRPLDFAVYRPDWRADEEILLLEAIESNGVGNWNDVAEQLGTRTAEECRQHYAEVYMKSEPEAPTPLSRSSIEKSRESLKDSKVKRPRLMNSEEALGAHPTPQSVPANHEIAGFMPLRSEFETEFENDAEVIIKDMIFSEEDTPTERQLKFSMLDIYSMALDRRAARHSFIFTHGLTDFKKHQNVEKSRSKDERELFNMLKPFSRFIDSDDLQRLLEGMTREEEIRRQIAHLQELRRNGIRSFEEVPSFEAERKHLELYLKGGSSVHPTSLTPNKPTAPIQEPFPLPAPSKFNRSAAPPITPVPTTISIPRATPSASSETASIHTSTAPTPTGTPVNGNIALAPASSGGRKASTPLNISHAEGVELLSEKERHLCSILRLYPRLYLSIKDTLIREYLKLGGLKRAQARSAVKIDVNKTSKLYDFFVAAGWIKPPASGE